MVAELLEQQTEQVLAAYSFAKRYGILILGKQKNLTRVVHLVSCPVSAIIELRRFIDGPIELEEIDNESFTILLTKTYEQKAKQAVEVAEDLGEGMDLQELIQDIPSTSDLLESESNAPVIRLINALLREAINKSASDIHFESFEKTLSVRLRIDGILHNVLEVPVSLAPLVVSRLKIMANLDISEKRLPQDGRIAVMIAGRNIDVRASVIPVSHGERVVLRLLDKKSVQLNLSQLGYSEQLLEIVYKMIAIPHGIILVTGPTGSGKTTSLYGMLTALNQPDRNIMTIEDPVEYDLPGIAQIPVNTKIDMTFAKGLRAILRQDPNVVMIGEIRDLETSIIALQASLTGHLVLSTLHTNTAVGAIARLRDMGVESFLLASSLIGIIAQRLIRMLCSYCKEPYVPSSADCELLNITEEAMKIVYRPKGCSHCNNTGYTKRIGIYSIVLVDTHLKKLIHDNASEQEIDAYAKTQLPTIQEDGIRRVLAGETSLEEIIRVTVEL